MTTDQKLALCGGCCNDFYNRPGNSPSGQCWSLESARVVERTRVGWWQNGPYDWRPETTLHCHHAPGQFSWIDADDVRIRKPAATDIVIAGECPARVRIADGE